MHDRNDRSESSSTATDEAPPERHEQCTVCETPIDTAEWFPIRGRPDDDGRFRVYTFCSEQCHETWENSRSDDAD